MEFAQGLTLSPEEKSNYQLLFTSLDTLKKGYFSAQESVTIWKRSNLPDQILSQIWQMVDKDNGNISQKGFVQAMRLMGAAQSNLKLSVDVMNSPGVLVNLNMNTMTNSLNLPNNTLNSSNLPNTMPTSNIPSDSLEIPFQEKSKYKEIFLKHQKNNLIDANTVKNIFIQSKLPDETLNSIWNKLDFRNGFLNENAFCFGMWLVQMKLQGNVGVNDKFGQSGMKLSGSMGNSGGLSGSLNGLNTGNASSLGINAGLSGNASSLGSGLGGTSPLMSNSEIPQEERKKAEQFYNSLDLKKKGYLSAEEVVPFFKKSNLSDNVLSNIWDLIDYDKSGRIDLSKFVVGWWLIQRRLTGQVPSVNRAMFSGNGRLSMSSPLGASMMSSGLNNSVTSGLNNSISSGFATINPTDPQNLKDVKQSYNDKQKEFQTKQDAVSQLQKDANQVQNEIAEYSAKKMTLDSKIKSLMLEQKELEVKLEKSSKTKDEEYKAFMELQNQFTTLTASISGARGKLDLEAKEIEMLKSKIRDGTKWIGDLNVEYDSLFKQEEELRKVKEELEAEFAKQKQEYEDLLQRVNVLKESKVVDEINLLKSSIEQQKNVNAELRKPALPPPPSTAPPTAVSNKNTGVDGFDWDALSPSSTKSEPAVPKLVKNDTQKSFSVGVSPVSQSQHVPSLNPASGNSELKVPNGFVDFDVKENGKEGTGFDDFFGSKSVTPTMNSLAKTPTGPATKSENKKDTLDGFVSFDDGFNDKVSFAKAEIPAGFDDAFSTMKSNDKKPSEEGYITAASSIKSPENSTKSPFDEFDSVSSKSSQNKGFDIKVAEKNFQKNFPTLDDFEEMNDAEPAKIPEKVPEKTEKSKSPFDDFEDEFKKLSTSPNANAPVVVSDTDFESDFFSKSNPFDKKATEETKVDPRTSIGSKSSAPPSTFAPSADFPVSFDDPFSNNSFTSKPSLSADKPPAFDTDPFAAFGNNNFSTTSDNPFGNTSFQEDPFNSFKPKSNTSRPASIIQKSTNDDPFGAQSFFGEKKSASTPTKPNTDELVKEIVNMGFTESQAKDALARYDNELSKAVHYLLDNNVKGHNREVSQSSTESKKKWWNPLSRSKSNIRKDKD